MAETAVASAHFVSKWDQEVYREYMRESGFMPYMRGSNNVIVRKRQLVEGGQTINVPFSPKLTGTGVTGAAVLKGNEEAVSIYNEQVQVEWLRHAVEINKRDMGFVNFDLRGLARGLVKDWGVDKFRSRMIDQFLSINASTTAAANTLYGTVTNSATAGPVITSGNYTASEANKDTYITANTDRILCGAVRSNVNSNSADHSAALATLDTTADTMRASIISLAKRMAQQANPLIRPIRISESGDEYYVLFCGTRAFRDAKADSTIAAANRDARPRVVADNPIFTGGELLYDGVIIKEIPELPILVNAGASGTTDVQPCFLCGQQAIAYALGQDMQSIEDSDDYDFRKGLGIEELSGIKKIFYNGKQHGVVTVYVAAAADS